MVFMLVNVVQQATVGHQLSDQLDRGAQANPQEPDQVGVIHARHDKSLLKHKNETGLKWHAKGHIWCSPVGAFLCIKTGVVISGY